ncbi:multidrug resistance-associated protein 1-like [Oppia nitens]|uniref:multidrug resistance-associated protein 1-like n=1 Tax=Oppia nitens TaxID=1686743 RepID=UPI0023DAB73B|nr:multidrug resistance-associated protein 1-like [Oppia nitens]
MITNGEIISLVAIDCNRFADELHLVIFSLVSPIQSAIIFGQLYRELGLISALSGLAILTGLIILCAIIAKYTKQLIGKQMSEKDKRLDLTNNVINGIKVTKLYSWEMAFHGIICKLRSNEIRHLRLATLLNTIYFVLATSAPYWIIFVGLVLYVLVSNGHNGAAGGGSGGSGGQPPPPPPMTMTAQKLFIPLALAQSLTNVLMMFPQGVSSLIWIWISIKRLERFLNLQNKCDYIKCNNKINNNNNKYAIKVIDGRFEWGSVAKNYPIVNKTTTTTTTTTTRFMLKNINLQIISKQFVAIVGNVGSGKSSLLAALLGEMNCLTPGSAGVTYASGNGAGGRPDIAYCSQQPWILNMSVKQNILFGKPYDSQRYGRVVQGCALGPDLRQLSATDETEIGEKGANLSGGQKQRISLARAVYSDADLYLLDDPFSSVDSHVARHLMFEVFSSRTGILKHTTRLLVTNQLSTVLSTEVDLIIYLIDGQISAIGSYDSLINQCKLFNDFVNNRQYSLQTVCLLEIWPTNVRMVGNGYDSIFSAIIYYPNMYKLMVKHMEPVIGSYRFPTTTTTTYWLLFSCIGRPGPGPIDNNIYWPPSTGIRFDEGIR